MNRFRPLGPWVAISLLVLAVPASAQRYRDETDANYSRRTVNEANQQNQREVNAAGAPASGGSTDALLQQYQNQWRNQAEQEKANRAAAARAEAAARRRAEALEAERSRLSAIRSARIDYRIGSAMNMAMLDGSGDSIALLTLFAHWFPEHAERLETWPYLAQFGPGDPYAVSLAALERAFALGSRVAPWLAASLEGEREWGGPPGVTWWLLLKANQTPPAGDDPMDGVTEMDWVFRGTISWTDAQLASLPTGVVRLTNPKEPSCDYTSASAVWDVGMNGYLSHLALAGAAHAGHLPLSHRRGWGWPEAVPQLLEKMRESHPGWGHLFTGLWYQELRGPRNRTAVGHLRQAVAAGGTAANFAQIALAALQEFQQQVPDIARDTASWQKNPANFRSNPLNLVRLADYHVSDEPLDVVNPALAALPPAERDQAAWRLALAALRDSLETTDFTRQAEEGREARLLRFVALKFLHLVAPDRDDLWPQRLIGRYPDALPKELLQAELPGNAARVYELLLQHPALDAYGNLPGRRQVMGSGIITQLAAYRDEFPVLALLAPAHRRAGGEIDVPTLLAEIELCRRLDLPLQGSWFNQQIAKRYDTLTLWTTMRLLTFPGFHNILGDPQCGVLDRLVAWMGDLKDYGAQAREQLDQRVMSAPVLFADMLHLRDLGRDFGADYLALANGEPVRATQAWPVDQFTPPAIARAAHLINASLGQLGASSSALPDTHPSVAWVREAGEAGDALALWVLRNRLETQRSPAAREFLKRAAQAGHDPAFQLLYSDRNLLADPALEADLWQMLVAGRGELAARMVRLAEETCERELPAGYDPATDFEKRLPQGDALKVIRQLELLTAARAACPNVAIRFLDQLPSFPPGWELEELETMLAESDLPWVRDRNVRAQAFAAAVRHIQQTMFYPGVGDVRLVELALKHLPQIHYVAGGDSTYPEAEATLAAIIDRWPGEKPRDWSSIVSDFWHVLAVHNRDRKDEAASLRCYRQAVAWRDAEHLWNAYFLCAAINQSAEDIRRAAPFVLRLSDEELLADSPVLLTTVAEVLAGPYGLPRDEARLRSIARLLTEHTGGVPACLASYAAPVELPPVGTPAWENLVRQQFRRLNEQRQPPHSAAYAWRLARHGLDLPVGDDPFLLLLPYMLLDRIAADFGHEEARAALARVEQEGTPEQRARRACAELWSVEPLNGAEILADKAQMGEAWAIRALELWILWDKLPKYAVEETYLAAYPQLRTPAVERWLQSN